MTTTQRRTNEEWLESLRLSHSREAALVDLRACVLRATRFYVQRHSDDLGMRRPEEVVEVAEDAAQDATLEILAKLNSFRGDAAFLTWASKFGISAASATLRRRCWRDVSLDEMSDGWAGCIAEPMDTAIDGQPELIAERTEVRALLVQVVRED